MNIYGLIGHPLGHSFSARIFNEAFSRYSIDARYCMFDLASISDLPGLLSQNPGIRGLNVTIPYKEAVIPYLDCLSDTARGIGAVNCIEIMTDAAASQPRLRGHNTDAPGFMHSIAGLLRNDVDRALVLGSGGASKAVCFALRRAGITPTVVSRQSSPATITYAEISDSVMRQNQLIVNTTPLGMWPRIDACPDIPYHLVTPRHICIDIVYNPDSTLFMNRCAKQGAVVKNGHDMLLAQAALSAEIWQLPGLIPLP